MHLTRSSTKDADTSGDSDTDKGGIPPETDSHSDYDDDIYVDELEDSIVSGCICGAFRKTETVHSTPETSTLDLLNKYNYKTNPWAKDERRPVSRSLGQETTCQCTRDIFRANTFCVG